MLYELPRLGVLASCYGDGALLLWSLTDGECVRSVRGVWSLEFASETRVLSGIGTGSSKSEIHVWDLETGDSSPVGVLGRFYSPFSFAKVLRILA